MFTVFDLETTGFSSYSDDVIQFSYVTFDDNNIMIKSDTLYFYYEGMSWSEEAYAVHQISQEFLKQYEDQFEENLIKMWTVLSGANVVGHNVLSFDCPFATSWLRRFGLANLQFGIIQDTMLALRPLCGGHKTKLMKLCSICGITEENIDNFMSMWFPNEDVRRAHNASYDVTATAILTLLGMGKGYISFTSIEAASANLAEVDMSLLDTASETKDAESSKEVALDFPHKEKVYFILIEEDGSETQRQFISNREKYNGYFTDSIQFPKSLMYVTDGVYESELNDGCTIRLQTSNYGDIFTVVTSFATLQTPDLDLRSFVENIPKGD